MTYHFCSGSWLAGFQSQQQSHANSLNHSKLQPSAQPSYSLPPQPPHQTLPTPYGGTPEYQLLKKSTAHSSNLQQPWAAQPTPLSHHHHPYPPHATTTPHPHRSASLYHGSAIVQKHHMHQERYQPPASFTHSWSDPTPGTYLHPWSDPTKPAAEHHHPQPNPNQAPPTTHTHRLSDPTKPPPATGPYPWTDPSKPIPADSGLLTVQQDCYQPLQDATNQQLSFEAATLTPIDPLRPSIPAPLLHMDPLPPSTALPLAPQDPLAASREALCPHRDPRAPSKKAPHDPLDPCRAVPSPPQNPSAPFSAGPSAVLIHSPAAAVAAASHTRLVLDSTVAGSPVASTHTHCIGALPKSSQAHNAAPRSQEACTVMGRAEQMTEHRKAPGLKLMPSQWDLPRKVVQVQQLQGVGGEGGQGGSSREYLSLASWIYQSTHM